MRMQGLLEEGGDKLVLAQVEPPERREWFRYAPRAPVITWTMADPAGWECPVSGWIQDALKQNFPPEFQECREGLRPLSREWHHYERMRTEKGHLYWGKFVDPLYVTWFRSPWEGVVLAHWLLVTWLQARAGELGEDGQFGWMDDWQYQEWLARPAAEVAAVVEAELALYLLLRAGEPARVG